MGLGMAFLDYLSEKQLLHPNSRILDIGSQNLYNAGADDVVNFARRMGSMEDDETLRRAAERISYYSTPRPGERTAFVAELFDLTSIHYLGYDVCPAPNTEIFDLNIQRQPVDRRNYYDILFNFGTTEHLINQLNAFEVMHDAMKIGGVALHQLPSVGWIDHGYFNYNALFLDDIVRVNKYEVVDKFYTPAGVASFKSDADFRNPNTPGIAHSASGHDNILNFNLNYFIRKTANAPFYIGLEIATTHAPLSNEAASVYGADRRLAAGEILRQGANEASATRVERQPLRKRLARILGGIRQ